MLTWGLDWWFGEHVDAVWASAGNELLGRQPVHRPSLANALAFELRGSVSDQPFRRIAEVAMLANDSRLDWSQLEWAVRHRPLRPEWSAALTPLRPLLDQWGAPRALHLWSASSPATQQTKLQPSILRRFQTDWGAYRAACGVQRGPRAAVMLLPGYLMGRWHLPGLGG